MKVISDLTVTARAPRPRSGLPQPSLRLDFVSGAYHPGGFGAGLSFARAGAARYHDAAGVMQLAAADQPRFDFDPATLALRGLLIEADATNLITRSEDLAHADWSKSRTAIVGQKAAPNGAGLSKVARNTDANQHYISRATKPITATAGDEFTVTLMVEAAEFTTVMVNLSNTDSGWPLINLVTGVVTGGNGRVSVTMIGPLVKIVMSCVASASGMILHIYPGGGDSAAGDGVSGLWVGQVQIEAGNTATSYIPTVAAPVTRAADICTLTLGSWWNTAEGTLLVEWQNINQRAGNSRIIGMAGGRSVMSLTTSTGQNNALGLAMWNGTAGISTTATLDITKGVQRGVAAWSVSGRSVAVRNTLANAATLIWDSGAPTAFYLGHDGAGMQPNGCLRRITYYAKRLSDAQLLSFVQV